MIYHYNAWELLNCKNRHKEIPPDRCCVRYDHRSSSYSSRRYQLFISSYMKEKFYHSALIRLRRLHIFANLKTLEDSEVLRNYKRKLFVTRPWMSIMYCAKCNVLEYSWNFYCIASVRRFLLGPHVVSYFITVICTCQGDSDALRKRELTMTSHDVYSAGTMWRLVVFIFQFCWLLEVWIYTT